MVRRQSIASTNTENCAGVSVIAPSTIGGQPQTAAVPVQAFEIVTALAAEDKQIAPEGISADHLLGLGCQAVEPVAQIDWTTRERNLGAGRQADHVTPFIARSARDSAFSLTKASTLTRTPFGSAISIDPDLHAGAAGCCAGSGSCVTGADGPSIRPIGMNWTVSVAPIATAAALRADRQL